jgi:6-methylsalicylate decarboxylase
MRIDVHAHYYTDKFSERMRGLGGTRNDVPGGAISLEQRLEMMDGIGVDTQVLCVGAQQPYYPDAAKATEAAHFANDFYKEVVEAHSGRFAAFGCVPLPHVDGAIAEAHRCLDEMRFPGINLGCAVAGGPLDNPDFEPFWAELNRMKTVVFLHPLGTGGPLMDAYGLAWTVGGCFEDTTAGLRIAMSGLMQRYPDVEIIVPHLGGTIPFVWQRVIDHAERADKPWAMDALRRMYYDTVNSTRLALHCTCEAVGAGHVLLGTDFPYLLGPKLERCVTYIEQAGLRPEDVTAILDHNAQALLKLPER